MSDLDRIQERIAQKRAEHRDLDDAITAMSQRPLADMIQIQRMKKRKLQLREEIEVLESRVLPDIIA